MTWGQIRLLCTKQLPGLDLDLLNGWMDSAYRYILDRREWYALEQEGLLNTDSVYRAGTVTVAQGNFSVVGTGTSWTGELTGAVLAIADSLWGYITGVEDATHLLIDRPWAGISATANYRIARDVYSFGPEVKSIIEMRMPGCRGYSGPWSRSEILRNGRDPFCIGGPLRWAPAADTAEVSGGPRTFRQARLYPAPDQSYPIPYRFKLAPIGFDGANVKDSPLAWVDPQAIVAQTILNGASSPLYAERPGMAGIRDAQKLLTEAAIGAMEKVDTAQRPIEQHRPADWIVRGQTRYSRR